MPQIRSLAPRAVIFSILITMPEMACPSDQTAAEQARFALYLVKGTSNAPLKTLALEEKPILTEDDVASYRISPDGRHFIRLKPGVTVRVAPREGRGLLDREFVVVADGSRIYLGDFHAPISSKLPSTVWVQLPSSRYGEAAELQIDIEIDPCPMVDREGKPLCEDFRADPRILKTLQDLGKLDTKPLPEGWGESYQGVKVRLAADKSRWRQGDEPSFKVEVLSSRNSEFQISFGPNSCRLSVDNTWFESASDRHYGVLAPGGHYESTVLLKPGVWQSRGESITLKPGKHQVRVMYDLLGALATGPGLISNTVEIEILPADAGN